MKFLQENITWLKDFFTLIFAGTATVIAILTYIRARATILQPIRTEVIKKQSELLTRLLQNLKEADSFEKGLDYLNLVPINVMKTLEDYGFVFKGHDEMFKKLQQELSGYIYCGESKIMADVEVVGTFEKKTPTESTAAGSDKFEKLKDGQVEIDKIYLSKRHTAFLGEVVDFADDPFMPGSIQKILKEVLNDVNNNLLIVLKGELESFMIKFNTDYLSNRDNLKFNPVGVYNEFNRTRVYHHATVARLKKEIRKYLRIDDTW